MTPGEYEVSAYAEGFEPQSKLVEVSESGHQEAPGNVINKNFNYSYNGSSIYDCINYRAFHRFGQAKFAYGGLVLGLSQFSLLTNNKHFGD